VIVSQCDGGHVQTPYTSSPVTLGSTAPPPVTSTPDESSSHGTTSHDCENVQESSNLLPDCWSAEQYSHFWNANTWLFVGKLRCLVCKNVQQIGPMWQGVGVRPILSDKWVAGTISPYGVTKSSQQTSLRKKIAVHKSSASHKAATEITATQQKLVWKMLYLCSSHISMKKYVVFSHCILLRRKQW